MKRAVWVVVFGLMAGGAFASPKEPEIKLRDVKLDGVMVNNSSVSLTATFDVKKEDLFGEMYIDFYILLEPREDEQGPQIFHCRTTHRFIKADPGYTSSAILDPAIVKCINPRHSEYAVVVTYQGKEVAVENSEDQRWWEDQSLGKHIENVLTRAASAPMVRDWEAIN